MEPPGLRSIREEEHTRLAPCSIRERSTNSGRRNDRESRQEAEHSHNSRRRGTKWEAWGGGEAFISNFQFGKGCEKDPRPEGAKEPREAPGPRGVTPRRKKGKTGTSDKTECRQKQEKERLVKIASGLLNRIPTWPV